MALQPAHYLLKRLKTARQDKQLSQRDFGEKVGMPQSQLSRIEAGHVDVQISTLIEMARTLGFELMLIPRQLQPMIKALCKQHESPSSKGYQQVPRYRLDDEAEDDHE